MGEPRLQQLIWNRRFKEAINLLNGDGAAIHARKPDSKGRLGHHACAFPLHRLHSIDESHLRKELSDLLIKIFPGGIKIKDRTGNLPIHYAVVDCSREHVESLINHYPESLQIRGQCQRLPVHSVSVGDQPDIAICEMIVQVYPEGLTEKDKLGRLPLHYAAKNGYCPTKQIELLIQQNPRALMEKDDTGSLPLHYIVANEYCSLESLKVIVENYTGGIQQEDNAGSLPLHCAIPYGHHERQQQHMLSQLAKDERVERGYDAVRYILDWDSSGVKHRNKAGLLPMNVAVLRGCLNVLKLLVEYYPDGLEERDYAGNLPLHQALAPGVPYYDKLVKFLVEHHKSSLDKAEQEQSQPIKTKQEYVEEKEALIREEPMVQEQEVLLQDNEENNQQQPRTKIVKEENVDEEEKPVTSPPKNTQVKAIKELFEQKKEDASTPRESVDQKQEEVLEVEEQEIQASHPASDLLEEEKQNLVQVVDENEKLVDQEMKVTAESTNVYEEENKKLVEALKEQKELLEQEKAKSNLREQAMGGELMVQLQKQFLLLKNAKQQLEQRVNEKAKEFEKEKAKLVQQVKEKDGLYKAALVKNQQLLIQLNMAKKKEVEFQQAIHGGPDLSPQGRLHLKAREVDGALAKLSTQIKEKERQRKAVLVDNQELLIQLNLAKKEIAGLKQAQTEKNDEEGKQKNEESGIGLQRQGKLHKKMKELEGEIAKLQQQVTQKEVLRKSALVENRTSS